MTELDDYRRLVEKPMIEAHIGELRRKDAEIERLRAALKAILTHEPQLRAHPPLKIFTIAQAALATEQPARRCLKRENNALCPEWPECDCYRDVLATECYRAALAAEQEAQP